MDHTGTVADIPDVELLRRAVKQCRSLHWAKGRGHTRREAVMDTFLLGSGYSEQLCKRFNLDPFEMVKR